MDVKALSERQPSDWPEEAREVLLSAIRDRGGDAAVRLLAVQLAGELEAINDQLARLLLDVIRDGAENEELRAAAAIALGPALELGYVDGFDEPDGVPISEQTFRAIQDTMREAYADADLPKEVRRRVLEGSVRAPRKWHAKAVREAYASNDVDWQVTAVFCMEYVRGFDEQILGALASDNLHIRYQAVMAAGNWGLDGAWRSVVELLASPATEKPLLLAAVEAAVGIRPEEAAEVLGELLESDDEEVVGAVQEALVLAEALSELDFDDDEEEGLADR